MRYVRIIGLAIAVREPPAQDCDATSTVQWLGGATRLPGMRPRPMKRPWSLHWLGVRAGGNRWTVAPCNRIRP
jgi:hypothetical protein